MKPKNKCDVYVYCPDCGARVLVETREYREIKSDTVYRKLRGLSK